MRTLEQHTYQVDTSSSVRKGTSSPEDASQYDSEVVSSSPQGLCYSFSSFNAFDPNFGSTIESSEDDACLAKVVKKLKKGKKLVEEARCNFKVRT